MSTYVDTEKNAQDYADGLRCEVGLYDNLGGVPQPNATSVYLYGNCTANPADCGSEGKVAPWQHYFCWHVCHACCKVVFRSAER